MDHLYVMPGASGTKISAAGTILRLRCHASEDGFQMPVGFLMSARHEARAMERARFSSAHSHVKEAKARSSQLSASPLGALEIKAPPLNDDVSQVEERTQ